MQRCAIALTSSTESHSNTKKVLLKLSSHHEGVGHKEIRAFSVCDAARNSGIRKLTSDADDVNSAKKCMVKSLTEKLSPLEKHKNKTTLVLHCFFHLRCSHLTTDIARREWFYSFDA
eukprot:gene8501-5967_t